MEMSAELHGMKYSKTADTKRLEAPDAIHLATAIALQSNFGVSVDAFHTFDNGGQRSINGRATPLYRTLNRVSHAEANRLFRKCCA
jgi:hypothetical protein